MGKLHDFIVFFDIDKECCLIGYPVRGYSKSMILKTLPNGVIPYNMPLTS